MVIVFLMTISWRRLYGKTAKMKATESYFSTVQTNLLRQLLSGPLLADDLNSILNVQEKSWEVQRRQRSIFLKELNVLGLRIFQVEIVLREKSPTDKRQVVSDDMHTAARQHSKRFIAEAGVAAGHQCRLATQVYPFSHRFSRCAGTEAARWEPLVRAYLGFVRTARGGTGHRGGHAKL